MSAKRVTIRYRRLPDRVQMFEQTILDEAADYVVTYLPSADPGSGMRIAGRPVLEAGAPIVWFTYPGRWYDIGRFHLANGTFTGTYANILTPVRMAADVWETTDLLLDVWAGADGVVEVLDRPEFDEAVRRGWMNGETAATAMARAQELTQAARSGVWPPPEVREWTLARARLKLLALEQSAADR